MARVFQLVAMAACVFLSSIAVAMAAASRIDQGPSVQAFAVCKRTDYPDVCVATVKPMQKSGPVTIAGTAKMSIEAAIDKATKAKAAAVRLMNADHGGKMRHGDFEVCQQEYVDALSALQASIKNLATGAHDELMDNLSAAMSSYSTCGDAFVESDEISPLTEANDFLTKVTSNSLALAQALPKRQ